MVPFFEPPSVILLLLLLTHILFFFSGDQHSLSLVFSFSFRLVDKNSSVFVAVFVILTKTSETNPN